MNLLSLTCPFSNSPQTTPSLFPLPITFIPLFQPKPTPYCPPPANYLPLPAMWPTPFCTKGTPLTDYPNLTIRVSSLLPLSFLGPSLWFPTAPFATLCCIWMLSIQVSRSHWTVGGLFSLE